MEQVMEFFRRKPGSRGRPELPLWLMAMIVPCAIVGVAAVSSAAEPLTLSDAVERARQHNPTLVASRARVEAARQLNREARMGRLPGIEISESGVRTTSPADVFGLQLMQERFSFAEFTANDPNNPDPLNNFTTQVQITMPLFTGGQLSSAVDQSARMADAAGAVRDHTGLAVELGVTEAYLGTLLARGHVELAARARETAARHVARAQDFYDSGMLVESDLLEARVHLASMDEALIRARHGAVMAAAGLNRAMGLDQELVFELTEPAVPETLALADSTALDLAWSGRNDLRAVRSQVAAAEEGINRARGEYWPQLGLAARYAWNDDSPFGANGESYAVAAVLQWKVWNWGQTAARVARSRSDYTAAREEQRAYEQQVAFEVRRAGQAVAEARARMAVTAGAVAAAERAHVVVEDRFDQGIARMTDLLDAETRAHEARMRDMQARFDYQKAVRTHRFVVGQSPMMEASR